MITSVMLQSGKVKMCLISFKTMTSSMQAVSVLKTAGISAYVVSIDPNLTKHGCSYGIEIPNTDAGRAVSVLNKKNIKYGEVFG